MLRLIFSAILVDTVPGFVHSSLVADDGVHVEVSGRLHELGGRDETGLESGGFTT